MDLIYWVTLNSSEPQTQGPRGLIYPQSARYSCRKSLSLFRYPRSGPVNCLDLREEALPVRGGNSTLSQLADAMHKNVESNAGAAPAGRSEAFWTILVSIPAWTHGEEALWINPAASRARLDQARPVWIRIRRNSRASKTRSWFGSSTFRHAFY